MKQKGFTLIEILVVISIISFIMSSAMYNLNISRMKARDSERIQMLKAFELALELYYDDYGKYPGWCSDDCYDKTDDFPGGQSSWCYTQKWLQSDGSCTGSSWDFSYDNSASEGFLKVLYDEGYISEGIWNDPFNPTLNPIEDKLMWNCRYIVPEIERDASNVQRYALYCRLEIQSYISEGDGGKNNALFEIQKPAPWLCIEDNADIMTNSDCI